jgi:hypothetical protein
LRQKQGGHGDTPAWNAIAGDHSVERRKQILFVWVLLFLLSACAIYPTLAVPAAEHAYDAATFHVYRGVLFSDARASAGVYPRWIQTLNYGLGGPLFSFYSPLSYVALDALYAIGLPHPVGWRVLVAFSLLAAAAGMYLLASALTGQAPAGMIAALVFVYSFPLLRDLYERGSPQGLAVALYPWVLWSLVQFIRAPDGRHLALASFAWAAVVLSHNLSAYFLLPAVGLIALLFFPSHRWRAPGAAALMLVSGSLLAAFFLLPSVIERPSVQLKNVTVLDYAQVAANSTGWRELLGLPPPYDLGLDNNLIGERVGPLAAIMVVLGLLAGPVLWIKRRRWQAAAIVCLALTGLGILWLQTPGADPVWRAIPPLAYVQARSRLLGVAAVAIALVTSFLVAALRNPTSGPFSKTPVRAAIICTMTAVTIVVALPILYPALQHRYEQFPPRPTVADALAFSVRENVPGLTAFNEFLPRWRWLPLTPTEAAQGLVANPPPGSQVEDQKLGTGWAKVELTSPVSFDAAFRVLYFPGWTGYLDGREAPLRPEEGTGYIVMPDVPTGVHTIELHYRGTATESAGGWITVATSLALLAGAVLWRPRQKQPAPAMTYPTPKWLLVAGVLGLLVLKMGVVDPHTTLFRRASICAAVQDDGTVEGVNVRFDDGIRLCAMSIPRTSVRPGEVFRVTLYWSLDDSGTSEEKTPSGPAHSFVHLLGTQHNPDTGNPLWGQQDKELPGYHPVTRWVPGKVYRDSYEFVVDPDAPPGEYRLEIGWVRPTDGMRLKPVIMAPSAGLTISDLDSLLVPGIRIRF